MTVPQSFFYKLGDPAATIRLRLVVGQAQKGATVVRLGDTLLAESNEDIVDLAIGTAADVKGRKLHCDTVITDVNPQTNLTSVTWEITGGLESFAKTCTEPLDGAGDSVHYAAVVYLL